MLRSIGKQSREWCNSSYGFLVTVTITVSIFFIFSQKRKAKVGRICRKGSSFKPKMKE